MSKRKAPAELAGAPAHGADVYKRLLDMIRDAELRPGTRLRESHLAELLGVSRTPVREALRRLEMQGLVTHEIHRGTVVRSLDHNTITELYFMREVLEGTAAASAARHASKAEIAALREMIEADRARLGDPTHLARTNQRFHAALYRASHNRYLVDILQGLRTSMWLLGPTTLSQPGRDEEALSEHIRIVDAIEAGDSEAADQAAQEHIRRAHTVRLKSMIEDESNA
ncbi:MAG: GntR family transcriptional regulator [Rhodospirillales bacterium]